MHITQYIELDKVQEEDISGHDLSRFLVFVFNIDRSFLHIGSEIPEKSVFTFKLRKGRSPGTSGLSACILPCARWKAAKKAADAPHYRVLGAELWSPSKVPTISLASLCACLGRWDGTAPATASALVFHWVTLISSNLTHPSLRPSFQNLWHAKSTPWEK